MCSRTLRATPLVHCTVLCKSTSLFVPITVVVDRHRFDLSDMTTLDFFFSTNDNEGVAEMLIESMGTTIVNTTDSKGRWETHTTPGLYVAGVNTTPVVNRVCVDAGRPFMRRLFPTTWSVSPFCSATELKRTQSTHTCAGRR